MHIHIYVYIHIFIYNTHFTFILQNKQVVLVVKNPPTNAGDLRDTGFIPGSGRSPGELLQYSCLENPMDRGA